MVPNNTHNLKDILESINLYGSDLSVLNNYFFIVKLELVMMIGDLRLNGNYWILLNHNY